MSVSIIFVNYYSEDFILKAVNSLYFHLKDFEYEIIVVNNSLNSDIHKLNVFREFGNFRIIDNTGNNGFSSGCNLGASNSKYNYLLFLNPDVELVDDSIKLLLNFHAKNSEVGISSGIMMYKDKSLQYCYNDFPNIVWELYHLFGFGYSKKIKELLSRKEIIFGENFEVDWFHGAFILINKEDFLKVGGFNENYFMYYEDVEICLKVKKLLRKKNICVPNVRILHEERSTVKENTIDNVYYFHMNRSKILFLRNYSFVKKFSIQFVSFVAVLIRLLLLPFWGKHKGNKNTKMKQLIKIIKIHFSNKAIDTSKFEYIPNA